MEKGIILNGTSSIAVAKDNDLIYRIDPVREIVTFEVGIIKAKAPIFIDLNDQINTPYKVIGFTLDGTFDDNQDWKNDPDYVIQRFEQVNIQVIEKDKIIDHLFLSPNGLDFNTDHFYLLPWQQLRMDVPNSISSLKLYCVPVLMNKPINLLSKVLVDQSSTYDESSNPPDVS